MREGMDPHAPLLMWWATFARLAGKFKPPQNWFLTIGFHYSRRNVVGHSFRKRARTGERKSVPPKF